MLQRRHHGWKHLRVPEEDEAWEFERAQMLHEDGELFDDVKKAEEPRGREAPAALRFPPPRFSPVGRGGSVDWHRRRCACIGRPFAAVLSTAMVFSFVDTSPADLFSSVSEKKKPCAAAVGRVEDEMKCVDILAGSDDDDGRPVIADDPEATPPVAPEEAEGVVVEREEAVVAADDH